MTPTTTTSPTTMSGTSKPAGLRTADSVAWPLRGAEAALVTLTVLGVVAMRRLFEDWSFLWIYLAAALTSHALAIVLRRLRWPVVASSTASLIAMVIFVGVLRYSDTMWVIVPSLDTWRQFGTDLTDAWHAFGEVKAPAEVLPGFLTVGAAGIWAFAYISDVAAFRIRTAVEAIAPTFILLVFTSMLGVNDYRLWHTGAFIAVAIGFTLFLRITYPLNASVPVNTTSRRQPRALASVGIKLALLAVALGAVFGPVLPGVDASPVIDWKELDGSASNNPRVVLSPLVDARGRLVEQSAVEVFRVKADRPAYWRISALDGFNGAVWSTDRSYRDASGNLSQAPPNTELLRQEFTITGLADIWMPAAYRPVSLDGDNIIWDEITSTLVVADGSRLSRGDTYRVISAPTIPTAEQLIAASPIVPPNISIAFTALPEDFSPRITELAQEITSGLATPYQKALALQNFFLDDFVYSLDVPTGHDGNRMESFLFDDRRGYCEQFAGTFAAMARSIGLPTRVAVGFTPGELVDEEYIVRGENYHAWPEVWIDGDWIYFEPTPGRGAPGAEAYTGVPAQQAVPGYLLEEQAQQDFSGPQVPTPVLEEVFDDESLLSEPRTSTPGGRVAPWVTATLFVILAGALIFGLWILLVPVFDERRRRRRRTQAGSDQRLVAEAAWADLVESLRVAGVPRTSTETHCEFAERAGFRAHLPEQVLVSVAQVVDSAAFGADAPREEDVTMTTQKVRDLEAQLSSGLKWQERLRRRAQPHRLRPRR